MIFFYRGRRYGIECKFSETPTITKSMNQTLESLNLTRRMIGEWVTRKGGDRTDTG